MPGSTGCRATAVGPCPPPSWRARQHIRASSAAREPITPVPVLHLLAALARPDVSAAADATSPCPPRSSPTAIASLPAMSPPVMSRLSRVVVSQPIAAVGIDHACKACPPPSRKRTIRVRRLLPHQAPAALRHRRSQCDAGTGACGGRGHHRSRHGQSGPAAPPARHRQAVRGGAQARRARLLRVSKGIPGLAQGAGGLLRSAASGSSSIRRARWWSRWARRRGSPISRRRSPRRATSILAPNPSYPIHTFGFHHRGRHHPRGADDARRAPISEALDRAAEASPCRRPSVLVMGYPVEPDGRGGRSRLLRAASSPGPRSTRCGCCPTSLIPSSIMTAARRPRSSRCPAPRKSRSSSPVGLQDLFDGGLADRLRGRQPGS